MTFCKTWPRRSLKILEAAERTPNKVLQLTARRYAAHCS